MNLVHPMSIVPFEHALHRCSEIDFRRPAQLLYCSSGIRYDLAHVVAADRDDLDHGVGGKSQMLSHHIVDFLD